MGELISRFINIILEYFVQRQLWTLVMHSQLEHVLLGILKLFVLKKFTLLLTNVIYIQITFY